MFYKVPFMIGSFHAPLYTMYAGFASFDANRIASGIGFRPATSKNDQPTFIAKHNMNMWLFQLSITGTDAFAFMNQMTASWIKYYCMFRMIDRVRPKGAV